MEQPDEKLILMTSEEISELVKHTINETLTTLGIDTRHPLAVQRDLQYLRDWRHTTESIRGKAVVAAVGIVVVGLCGVFWLGFKALFTVR